MSFFRDNRIKLNGTRRSSLDLARSRLVMLSAFFIFAYVIVAARAADLSIIQGALQTNQEEDLYEKLTSTKQEKRRADIVDRNGVLLARSLKTSSLYADPVMVQDASKTAKELHKIFPDVSYGSLLQKLQTKKRFVWVKRNISPDQQAAILYLGMPGLNFKEEMRRIYPQGALAVHMVGTSGVDGQGLSGIEGSFNTLLDKESDALQLTLDVRLQHIMKREIAKTIKKFKAKAGAGLIMDVENGEILAAVSLPDYEPQNYQNAKENEKFNRVSLGVYELGSSFKIFSTAAMIEKSDGVVSSSFDVRKPIKIGRFQIRDYHPEKRIMSLPEVFIHSSNIGSALMGQRIGSEGLKDFYNNLGLLTKPDFEIGEIGNPLSPKRWTEVNTLTASFGHGIAVSPLQLTRAAASIINGGELITPTIVKNKDVGEKTKTESPIRVVSPQTSHRMRQLLRMVVTEGTGSKAEVDGFMVGGKTGTAEKPGKGGYNRKKLISSFLGAFPMDAPRYMVFVMVDEPQGTKETYGYATGGWVGAPTVARIISSMSSVTGIMPQKEKEPFEKSLKRYIKTKEQIKKERNIEAH